MPLDGLQLPLSANVPFNKRGAQARLNRRAVRVPKISSSLVTAILITELRAPVRPRGRAPRRD